MRIKFKATKQHANADMLSRLYLGKGNKEKLAEEEFIYSIQSIMLPVATDEIKKETAKDRTLREVRKYLQIGNWQGKLCDELMNYYI